MYLPAAPCPQEVVLSLLDVQSGNVVYTCLDVDLGDIRHLQSTLDGCPCHHSFGVPCSYISRWGGGIPVCVCVCMFSKLLTFNSDN